MKAITIHQPWATLMAMGLKRIETRSWATSYRGSLAIHAAKTFPAYARAACWNEAISKALGGPLVRSSNMLDWGIEFEKYVKALPLGCIVATCELVRCIETEMIPRYVQPFTEHERALGNYEPGRYGWLTENMVAVKPPIAAVGAQGLWEWAGIASGNLAGVK